MSSTLARAIRVLETQTAVDNDLAEAVLFMAADAGGPDDPFGEVAGGVGEAAAVVNARRLAERQEVAAGAALDTAQVVAAVRSLSDRKGVDRRRRRRQLLGWRVGTRTLHPAWQFDRRRGDTRPGLPQLLAALAEVAPDPQAADALMRAPRPELEGRSLADLFAAGQLQTVLRLVRAAAEQS